MNNFQNDIQQCLEVLNGGGLILYPTDTIWGIGCDATNPKAVAAVYKLKKREDKKSMIILVGDERDVLQYVAGPDLHALNLLEKEERPTTVIYDNGIGLADNLIHEDGSVGIRMCKDEFCRHLIKRFRKPIVSTSANISGKPFPSFFDEIDPVIKSSVDYVVHYRREDHTPSQPSRIIKWNKDGSLIIIRP